nr:HPF/RaiA family ribosome-associated protein [uncultured Ralstonia sp.]
MTIEFAHHLRLFVPAPQHVAGRANWFDPSQGAGNRAIKNEHINVHTSNQTNRSLTMSVPVDISFQGIAHSKAVEEAVINRVDRLERIRGDLLRCRVSLAVGARHQHQGKPFDVHIHVFTPQQTHVSSNTSNEDPYVALHEAFTHVERMLVQANGKHSSQS